MAESTRGLRGDDDAARPEGFGPLCRLSPPIQSSEMAAIWPLVEACFGRSWRLPLFEEAVADPQARFWVLRQPGAPASGFLLARRILEGVEVDLLGVDAGQRKRGIAGQLLDALIEEESASGALEVLLELRRSNEAAQALYAGRGFMVVGERSRYYPDGEDALLWTLDLRAERDSEQGRQV